ncbi:dolichyl-phosphate-mannose--protein mannosyltransferase [Microbacterium ulmi]|uniref:dolichyl-phosphate-mannose--protein mannosyltransferase n=1 Tax=Microbacterium ulmi TaxID=179095 RepID=UPI003133031D|nr:dolichyl-phosphate-mannose--protein O-mannosyl transferase [Microbacterium ulmi]
MTTTAEPLLPAVLPSLYDRWLARVARDPALARRWRWLAPALVTLVAGILRVWNLGHPHALVFDETYYVKDAWSQWNLGYPSTWPEGANDGFVAGDTDIFTSMGSFVVHPPLGKWLIGVGMWLFGADSSFGWRIATAVFGTATVLVLYFVAQVLTGSIAFATVASGLMAIDGLAIVMSRIGLLDIFLTFFVLVAFWFVLLDRRAHLPRLAAGVMARTAGDVGPVWGPVLWRRPWLVAAGVAAGAATAVKWSGLYVIAGLAIYLVVTDALARRRAGVGLWTTDALRQGLAAAALALPAGLVVYLASWTGWLVTDGGYGRHAIESSAETGVWSWLPLPLQNLWKYHEAMYGFHVGLTSGHTYASPAWQWPLLLRPTSMYFHRDAPEEAGCAAANGCVQNIYSMPNPLIWYAGVAAVVYLAWRFAVSRDWRYAVVLTGVAVTYVPWLLYPQRTIFQFYTIAILPFMLLALAFALRDMASGPPGSDVVRRISGQRVVLVFLAFVVVVSAFWYPIVTAMPVPYDFWRLHNWMQSWV